MANAQALEYLNSLKGRRAELTADVNQLLEHYRAKYGCISRSSDAELPSLTYLRLERDCMFINTLAICSCHTTALQVADIVVGSGIS